jgi:hypothetical protein
MAANDINISDLTYEGIRTSLINYLKNQETFKDYNFEGSAIRTLIDLLAYNTFYYGYYSNMIANEMFLDTAKLPNSLISLTKPLGYLVYNSLSAKATIRFNNLNSSYNSLSAFSTFRGNDSAGRPYYFYNIREILIGESSPSSGLYQTPYFEVYEGRAAVKRQLVNIDLETQTFSLTDIAIDPRTIVVEVGDVNGENLVVWDNYYLNPDTIIGPETEIFFVERTKNGYNVNFGKYSSSDEGSLSTGKTVTNQNTVFVSYLVSSGSNGNGVSNISFLSESQGKALTTSSSFVEVSVVSRNGVSEPDADEIRFFAPKTFAKQNRLVTKNDYYAALDELGYGSGSSPEFTYKVFGGEEASPPVYGRVFVSIIDLNSNDTSDFNSQNEINEVLSTLKAKSVVSILPEYLAPVEMNAGLTLTVYHPNAIDAGTQGQIKLAVRNALYAEYGPKKYDRTILNQDVVQIARDSYSGLQVLSAYMNIRAFSAALTELQGRKINFKSELASIEKISGFDNNYVAKTNEKYLYLYNGTEKISTSPIGEVDFGNGIVTIYANITKNALTIDVTTPNQNFTAKDEIVCFVPTTNEISIKFQ